jgi:hypothetical protein
MSLGEDRVRTSFISTTNSQVEEIKRRTADCIDWVEAIKDKDQRLAALAQTAYETAAMWAVKLATTDK